MVKNLPATRETWVWSLGGEDPLEKEMAAHSSVLTWEIPQREEPGGLQHGVAKSHTRLSDWTATITLLISPNLKLLGHQCQEAKVLDLTGPGAGRELDHSVSICSPLASTPAGLWHPPRLESSRKPTCFPAQPLCRFLSTILGIREPSQGQVICLFSIWGISRLQSSLTAPRS